MKIEKIDHVHIRVKDLEKAIQRLEDLLGVKFEPPWEPKMCESPAREFLEEAGARGAFALPGLDLTSSTRADGALAEVIERMGEGLTGGIAFKVADIDAAIAEWESKGVRLEGRIQIGDLKEAWFNEEDTCGMRIELIEYPTDNLVAALPQRR